MSTPGVERRGHFGVIPADRELRHMELAEHYGARSLKAIDQRYAELGPPIAQYLARAGRRNTLGLAEILHGDRNAMQRPPIPPRAHLGVGLCRRFQRSIFEHGQIGTQLWIRLFNSRELDLRNFL